MAAKKRAAKTKPKAKKAAGTRGKGKRKAKKANGKPLELLQKRYKRLSQIIASRT